MSLEAKDFADWIPNHQHRSTGGKNL